MLTLCRLFSLPVLTLCRLFSLPVLTLCRLFSLSLLTLCRLFSLPVLTLCRLFSLSLLTLCRLFSLPVLTLCRLFSLPVLTLCRLFSLPVLTLCRLFSLPLLTLCRLFSLPVLTLCHLFSPAADLCHLWPSWSSPDVPLRFRVPKSRNPTTSIVVNLSTNGTAELYLYEDVTPERYYLVTLTESELTLSRSERGVMAARRVARACLAPQSSPTSRYRLLWVSILRGFISVGEDGRMPCEATETTISPTVGPYPEEETEGPIPGSAEVTEVTEVTGVTTGQPAATTTPLPERVPRTELVTWQDGLPYTVRSYGVRTPDGHGVWTVDCEPSSGEGRGL